MKALVIRSFVIALVLGAVTGFFDSFIWLRDLHKYDPPISLTEAHDLARLPASEMQLRLVQREKHLTKMEWLGESIRYPYFWQGVVQKSVFPIIGIFSGCLLLGVWNLRASKSQ
jgi:hypothetical protein